MLPAISARHLDLSECQPAPAGVNASLRREVTVIIAAWRASATIGRAISSALAQRETAEVIVVDDASNDGGATIAAARAADDGSGRLVVLEQETNTGPSRARNIAIANSTAPWIAILDSDDWMEPGRFAALLAVAHEGYDIIADDLLQVKEGQDASTGRPLWFEGDRTPIDISLGFFIATNMPQKNRHRSELGYLKPLLRRAFLDRHSLGYDEAMRLAEDYDLYARTLSLGARMRLIPWSGYVSVIRKDSLSARQTRTDLAIYEAADDRLIDSGRLSEAEKSLVKRHQLHIRSRIVWIDFMAAIKAGKPFRALTIMLRDPRHAPYVLRGLWTIFLRRLGLKAS